MIALALVLGITPLNEPREPDAPAPPRALQGGKAWGGHTSNSWPALSGPVTHVFDGDTIALGEVAVRLSNLDCPEADTPSGRVATRRMTQLTASGMLSCSLTGERSYQRWIGRCQLSDGRDIGRAMISEGYCRRWQ